MSHHDLVSFEVMKLVVVVVVTEEISMDKGAKIKKIKLEWMIIQGNCK